LKLPKEISFIPLADAVLNSGGQFEAQPERKTSSVLIMPTVTLELPEDLFSALRRSPQEFMDELRLAAAIHWYERGKISQERAAQVAGLDRTDFLQALAREQADAYVVSFDDLKQELERG
jgi:predicted HTH domain antitoxin